jgi:[ribosomal protein S5]-alanine N-acetyltransferase
MQINSERIILVLDTIEETLDRINSMKPEVKALLSENWLNQLRDAETESPWIHGFSILRRSDNLPIGQCGFKGPPNADGMVEIAYHTYSEHERRGYATEAALAMIEFAFQVPEVIVVRAHTLPEENASTWILQKCGFRKTGEIMDPEDGRIWRWEITSQTANN